MSAVRLRVLVLLRRRGTRVAVLGVLIGIVAGIAMGLAGGTRRTATAPDRYTMHVGGDPDVVILQFAGPPLTEEIAALPGVASTEAITFVSVVLLSPTDGSFVLEANPFVGDDEAVGARIVEGRFVDPDQPDEFTINRPLARMLEERFDVRVGDRLNLAAYDQTQVNSGFDPTTDTPAIASFSATLVGITESPSEFDEPDTRLVFPPSFLDAHPGAGVVQTLVAAELRPGVTSTDVMDAVRAMPFGEDAVSDPTRIVSEGARRAVRFQVVALWLVSALATLAAAIVVAQLVGRTFAVTHDERRALEAIGWRGRDLAGERGVLGATTAVVAAPVATLVAAAVTARFPIGALRSLEPDPGWRADPTVSIVGVAALFMVVVGAAALAGGRRPTTLRAPGRRRGASSGHGWNGVALTVGTAFASSAPRGHRTGGGMVAGVAAIAGTVAAAAVGITLNRMVDQPERWGVTYDQLFGNPYAATPIDIVGPIRGHPDVAAVTGATIGTLTIDGADTSTFAYAPVGTGPGPTVLEGRAPRSHDDIGLGAEVARRLDAVVGDEVEVAGTAGDSRTLVVVGIVATPDSAGDGAAVTFDAFLELNPAATLNLALVEFRDGASSSAVDDVTDLAYSPPAAITTPSSVRALERVTTAPALLAMVLAFLLVIGAGFRLTTSVRARDREVSVLNALGADRRQLRGAVHWQASLTATLLAVVGVPLGIFLARWVSGALTTALGIVPGTTVPVLAVIAIVVIVVAAANALAYLPARRAGGLHAIELTRDR